MLALPQRSYKRLIQQSRRGREGVWERSTGRGSGVSTEGGGAQVLVEKYTIESAQA